MMAFLQYLMQILMGVMMATFMTIMIPRAAVSAKRIGEVLETEPTIERVAHGESMPTPGTVELQDVVFRYPGAETPVLDGVSFKAEPGETVAIIGSTGAGKTTLVNLIPRLFDATGGRVLVGGADVKALDAETLWRGIAIVPQRPYLFGGTVASNLRYGNEQATDEQLWRALEIAQAAGFVQQMEGQLDARIAQGGTQRLRRPAPAAVDRASARGRARRAGLRRLLLGARPDHGCAPAGGAVGGGRADHAGSSSRSASRRSRAPTASWCWRPAGSSAPARMTSCSRSSDTYREIVDSQMAVEA